MKACSALAHKPRACRLRADVRRPARAAPRPRQRQRASASRKHHLNFARARALTEAGLALEPAAALVMCAARAQGRRRGRAAAGGLRRSSTEVIERMFAELRRRRRRARGQRSRRATGCASAGATESHPLILFGDARRGSARHPGRPPTGARRRDLRGRLGADRRLLGRPDALRNGRASRTTGRAGRGRSCTRRRPRRRSIARRGSKRARRRRRAAPDRRGGPDLGRCLHGAGHAIGHRDPRAAVPRAPRRRPRSSRAWCFTIEPGHLPCGVGRHPARGRRARGPRRPRRPVKPAAGVVGRRGRLRGHGEGKSR